ncbi:MAG: bifunctional diaminohydroxyphosphoribosylaminopyrimidine deaminase/5-amino-6-(5-phosphoribosylamino)uracil reductase RibD [Bauldia sp.]|nr:bifunctional diaminohydroxyphosphoribosylaminopyrimidine deaminase/5-amino-6-(5-phosphoribosylamino)uracil reductase RibD [Bauldia sp.]
MAEMTQGAVDPALDRRFMAAALRLGRRNLGRTYPNPAVGALVVRFEDGAPRVVGRGWTGVGGRPHAEAFALAMAGSAAKGATVYVTLEPCVHVGRGEPCTHALIAAGVGRVVTTMADPDPRTAGEGHELLRNAGIEVTTGVLEREGRIAHAGHLSRLANQRPLVTLKLGISADGMIGTRAGDRMMITGKAAFDRVQTLRAEYDAVMIGVGTALVDDPRLTVRQPGLEDRSPIRVVLDTNARLPLNSKLVQSAGEKPLWLIVSSEAPAERKNALANAGVEVIEVGTGSGGLAIADALTALSERGITRVLAEGGAKIAASLVSNDLTQEVILIRAPVVVGPDGIRALAGLALSAVERSPRYQLVDESMVGEDNFRRYLRA